MSAPSILEVASGITRDALATLADKAGGDASVAGVTIVALLGDGHFAYPLSSGPSDEQIAALPAFDRRLMANLLRELAGRWEPNGEPPG